MALALSDINRLFIEAVCTALGIKTKTSRSSDYEFAAGRTRKAPPAGRRHAATVLVRPVRSRPNMALSTSPARFTIRRIGSPMPLILTRTGQRIAAGVSRLQRFFTIAESG